MHSPGPRKYTSLISTHKVAKKREQQNLYSQLDFSPSKQKQVVGIHLVPVKDYLLVWTSPLLCSSSKHNAMLIQGYDLTAGEMGGEEQHIL